VVQPLVRCEGFGRRSKVRRRESAGEPGKRESNGSDSKRLAGPAAGADASNGGHAGKPIAQIERSAQSNRRGFGRSKRLAQRSEQRREEILGGVNEPLASFSQFRSALRDD